MSVAGDVIELKKIKAEIKNLQAVIRTLHQQAKTVEKRIIDFLQAKEQHGMKYKGTAIILENKTRRAVKKKADKEEDIRRLLYKYGINDSEQFLIELTDAQKGEGRVSPHLKIQKYKLNH
jgi:hypothetical protein